MPPKKAVTAQQQTTPLQSVVVSPTPTTPQCTDINTDLGKYTKITKQQLFSQEQCGTNTKTPLVNRINSTSNIPFKITNIENDPLGRRAVAITDLPAGTTIACEESPLWVIAGEFLSEYCFHCAKNLRSDQQQFCSPTCFKSYQRIFMFETPFLSQIPQLQKILSVDIDLLRLAIRFFALRYFDAIDNAAKSDTTITVDDDKNIELKYTTPTNKGQEVTAVDSSSHCIRNMAILQPDVVAVESLQGHAQFETDEGIIRTAKHTIKTLYPTFKTVEGGKLLSTLYPAATKSTTQSTDDAYYKALEQDFLSITGRINANIHSLQTYPVDPTIVVNAYNQPDPKSTPKIDIDTAISNLKKTVGSTGFQPVYQWGMGLFPIAAMFNHSCEPNCTFINQGNILCTRTLKPIKAGEELLVSYVSLNSDVLTRRYSLLQEKGFWCQCTRCNNEMNVVDVIRTVDQSTTSAPLLEPTILTDVPDDNVQKSTPVMSKNAKAAANIKAAMAAKGKNVQKQPVAKKVEPEPKSEIATTPEVIPCIVKLNDSLAKIVAAPSVWVTKADPKALSQHEILADAFIRKLFDTFIGGSIFSHIIDKIETAKLIPQHEARFEIFTDFDLYQSVDRTAGHMAQKTVQSNAIIYSKHLTLLKQWFKDNVQQLNTRTIVTTLSQQCNALSKLLTETTIEFKNNIATSLNKSSEVNELPSVQDVQTIFDTQSAGTLITGLNKLYPGGLDFPSFESFTGKNEPPQVITSFYQALESNLHFYSTAIPTNMITSSLPKEDANTNQACDDVQSNQSRKSSLYRKYIILCVNAMFGQLLNEMLICVQDPTSSFASKQNQVETFASLLFATYPISHYHNQYQIVVLLSNIVSAQSQSAPIASLIHQLTTLLPTLQILFFITKTSFPSHFVSVLEACQLVMNVIYKCQAMLRASTNGANATTAQKLGLTFNPILILIKENVLKRLGASLRVHFGSDHVQTRAILG